MNILMSSYLFAPSVGGIETVSSILAHEFTRLGARVVVITQTPSRSDDNAPFEIARRPSASKLMKLLRWSDVYFQNNIALNFTWPLALLRRPLVVALHTWLTRAGGQVSWRERVKQRCLRGATCISVSSAIARHIAAPSTIIGNPYDDGMFRRTSGVPRARDIVFLGRLVSDKGADLLIDALAELKERGLQPTLTLVGSGPEEPALREAAMRRSLERQITFAGQKTGDELVRLLNAHRILAIPSRWQEPFGIVALEGIACGCAVVAADSGGLPDAIGPCGITFERGNAAGLAQSLAALLENPERIATLQARGPQHLARHTRTYVAQQYFNVIERAAATL